MNSSDIQRLIDFPDNTGFASLPAGEYEGPFTVSRPVKIIGNNTVLWGKCGTVLDIRSNNVSLENLSVEITGNSSETAVLSKDPKTIVKNVYVNGNAFGFENENDCFILPKIISLGKIKPNEAFELYFDAYFGCDCLISSEINGISVYPENVKKGKNEIKIHIEPCSEDAVIYGAIEVKSLFLRKIYLNFSVSDDFTVQSGIKVFDSDEQKQSKTDTVPEISHDFDDFPEYENVQEIIDTENIVKGQRLNMADVFGDIFASEFFFESCDKGIEIDCYTFLLNEDALAEKDDDLVFFGNNDGGNGAVRYTDNSVHKVVSINLEIVPERIQSIAIVYSVYGDDPDLNFGKIYNARIVFTGGNGEKSTFTLDTPLSGKTLIAAQVYRKDGKWKLNAVGQEYKSGLKKLCESFGLTIEG